MRKSLAWCDTRNSLDWEQSDAEKGFFPLGTCSNPFSLDKQNVPANRFPRFAWRDLTNIRYLEVSKPRTTY